MRRTAQAAFSRPKQGKTPRKARKAPTVAKLKKQAWKLLSELVRRNNADGSGWCHCYTCSQSGPWKIMQAGHAIPGRTGAVLLDEEIIRPQCVQCNIWGRGMHYIFSTKLIQENGMEWWERKLLGVHQIAKWSRSDLQSKIEDYKERLAKLG